MKNNIKRTLESSLISASKQFKVIMLTGPRQVGKTTLLQHIQQEERHWVTLDDLTTRVSAKQDPASFIAKLKLPCVIDEIQYVPELFPYIKMVVDEKQQPGMFWLTGSQQFEMMQNVTESLAGRVAILNLSGISQAEEQQHPNTSPFLPDNDTLQKRQSNNNPPLSIPEIYEKIWRGSYPEIVTNHGNNWELFYSSYLSTYIQQDIRSMLNIHDLTSFYRFMQIAASRSGQWINYSDMARDIGMNEKTVKSWLRILETSGIIYLLTPYFNNHSKRLIKAPKLYFMDTGLCSFLSGWLTPDVLERGAMSGAILETWVVSEIIKSWWHNGRRPAIYFYRDKDHHEVDILLEINGQLHPIEIKKTATLTSQHFAGFDFLQNLGVPIGHGAVLCFAKSLLPLNKHIDAVPIAFL